MARWACIYKWKPEKTKEVLQKFADYVNGKVPDVLEAAKRSNWIAWEFPSAFGQTTSVFIVEGNEVDISPIMRYWWDVGTYKILPCVNFDTIVKFYPDRIVQSLKEFQK
jgi:hypothetical protein